MEDIQSTKTNTNSADMVDTLSKNKNDTQQSQNTEGDYKLTPQVATRF